MKFGTYVDTLASIGFGGKSKAMLGYNLFMAAGPCSKPSVEAVKTWLNGTRSCRVGRYFPEESIDEVQFISYFRRRTNGPTLWKQLQMAFGAIEEADTESGDFCVDLNTNDPDVFYWSLLNQFQRIFHLPESEREVNSSTAPIPTVSQNKPSVEQVRDIFLQYIDQFNVMNIINRKPAILNRDDSLKMDIFIDRMEPVVANCNPIDHPLYASINDFVHALRIQVLSLDATLNNRFGSENNTASINMEDHDEDWIKDNKKVKQWWIPKLDAKLITYADNPAHLIGIANGGWESFKNKMNALYKDILSGIDKW